MNVEKQEGNFYITTDKAHLNIDIIHQFSSEQSYRARGIDQELIEETLRNSQLCYGV
ncbi:hypothetical protein [Bacillus sp. 165]|uniref:hypothetical protein n=1 Tax=Bacillus sp. 165 TaxID=1529117 RepID=UPI001ADB219F|nr:hypothetical protein [Bacillus sp. 165]MBO9128948.1 hypothetical protein [Bacillus sp. 165]